MNFYNQFQKILFQLDKMKNKYFNNNISKMRIKMNNQNNDMAEII